MQSLICLTAFVAASAAGAAPATTNDTPRALSKKLIQYGWGIPDPAFIHEHIRDMEKRPFQGLIFRLRGGIRVFSTKPWSETQFAEDYEILPKIAWRRFTDNFVIMLAASDQDWFDDAQWNEILRHARLMAKAARLGRCKGVCFDPEPYGPNPWAYARAAHRGEKSFAQYEAKVRQRGAQFLRAIETELPGAVVLTFFQLSYFSELEKPMSPAERAQRLSRMSYSLLPAFLNGMLDAASPAARIVDGNERAYYYRDKAQYFEAYHAMKQRARLLIDPALWPKYRLQVQAGFALYLDQYFGLRTRRVEGHYLTPEQRAQWCEHNAYWALYAADEYVWCYCERMHWFRNQHIPPGCEAALRSAQQKLARGEPMTIDMKPIMEEAKRKQDAEIRARLVKRRAEIRRLPKGAAPRIDGDLSDAAWRQTPPLEPFLSLALESPKLTAKTLARVTYDESALYVAFQCEEPRPARMRVVGARRDDPIWAGDDVEVMVCAPGGTLPFYHFMVNPKGVVWDGVHRASGSDTSYNPTWRCKVKRGRRAWTAEMAIPWAAMRMSCPQPGTVLRANLCRQRRGARELSAWTPMVRGFLEHELYGVWVFK